jgi:hypothetical protein
MRVLILTAVFGGLLAAGSNAAPVPKVKDKTTEEKLAGKWKLVKTDGVLSDDFDFYIEYKAKGAMVFTRVPKASTRCSRGAIRSSGPSTSSVTSEEKPPRSKP